MGVQTTYGYSPSRGLAGGLYDMSPRAVNSRIAEEQIVFGIGLMPGTAPGRNVVKPSSGASAADFEGIALNGGTQEMDMDGVLNVKAGTSVSVLRYGRAWVRVEPEQEVEYGDDLYLITDGENAGYFTNSESSGTKVALAGRFIGANGEDGGGIAPVELYNAPAPAGE